MYFIELRKRHRPRTRSDRNLRKSSNTSKCLKRSVIIMGANQCQLQRGTGPPSWPFCSMHENAYWPAGQSNSGISSAAQYFRPGFFTLPTSGRGARLVVISLRTTVIFLTAAPLRTFIRWVSGLLIRLPTQPPEHSPSRRTKTVVPYRRWESNVAPTHTGYP